jgi:hypothetical protein
MTFVREAVQRILPAERFRKRRGKVLDGPRPSAEHTIGIRIWQAGGADGRHREIRILPGSCRFPMVFFPLKKIFARCNKRPLPFVSGIDEGTETPRHE